MSRISSESVFNPDYQSYRLTELSKRSSVGAVDQEIGKIDRVIKAQQKFRGKTEGLAEYRGKLVELKAKIGCKVSEAAAPIKPKTERQLLREDLVALHQERDKAASEALKLKDAGGPAFRKANSRVLNLDRKILDIKLALRKVDIREEAPPPVNERVRATFEKATTDPRQEYPKVRKNMLEVARAIDTKIDRLAVLEAIGSAMRGAANKQLSDQERVAYADTMRVKIEQFAEMSRELGARIEVTSLDSLAHMMMRELDDINDLNAAYETLAIKAYRLEQEIQKIEKETPPKKPSLWTRVQKMFSREKPSQAQQVVALRNALTDDNLKEEGIFREAGSAKRIGEIVARPDQIKSEEYVHTKANAFKRYLRDNVRLEPKEELQKDFMSGNFDGALQRLNGEQREIVETLRNLLQETVAQQGTNKMTPQNLGIVFGPVLAAMLSYNEMDLQAVKNCNLVVQSLCGGKVNFPIQGA